MADTTDLNKYVDRNQVDYVETPRQPGEEYAGFSAARQREAFLGGGGAEKDTSPKLIVGASKRRDGSLDTSHAMELILPPEKAANVVANRAKEDAERLRKRQEQFAIPENVNPNSSEHVWYTLKNAGLIAKENIDKYRTSDEKFWDHTQIKRDYDKFKRFKLEQLILEDLSQDAYRQAFDKEADESMRDRREGKPHVSQLKNRFEYPSEFPPAAIAIEKLDKYAEKWQQMVDESPGAGYTLLTKYSSSEYVPIQDILSVLPDLQTHLAAAAVASK